MAGDARLPMQLIRETTMRTTTFLLLAAAVMASATVAPGIAADKKKAAGKKCGEFMYADKKTGKCMDARDKKG